MFNNIKMTPVQKKLWTVLKFLIVFNLLAIPLHLILYFNVNVYALAFIERVQASFFLNVLNIKHVLYDVTYGIEPLPAININQHVLAIGEPCTALRSVLAFTALVIASPKKWSNKKSALLLLPFIYEANILRIVTLALVGLITPSMLELVHIILWREGMLLLIIGLWIYWLNRGDLLWNALQKVFNPVKSLEQYPH